MVGGKKTRLGWMTCAAALVVGGCAPSSDRADPEIEALAQSLQDDSAASEYVHDLGTVLACGQTLTHRFSIENHDLNALRLLHIEPIVPCCSSVLGFTSNIPPGQTGSIDVSWRIGSAADGPRRVEFAAATSRGRVRFALAARVVAQVEFTLATPQTHSKTFADSDHQIWKLTCRRRVDHRREGAAGRDLPTSFTISGGGSAYWDSEALVSPYREHDAPLEANLRESVRFVRIELPTRQQAGEHVIELLFEWPDGYEDRRSVRWHVEPAITIAPGAIFLANHPRPDSSSHQLLIASADQTTFRVLGMKDDVPGVRLAPGRPTETAGLHMIVVRVDHSIFFAEKNKARIQDVILTLDHPRQKSVAFSLFRKGE